MRKLSNPASQSRVAKSDDDVSFQRDVREKRQKKYGGCRSSRYAKRAPD
jgi:hypothetical protein